MSALHRWYVPQRIIYSVSEGDQDIESLTRASSELSGMLDEGTPLVHVIIDTSRFGTMPLKLTQIGAALGFVRHPSLGWVIVVNPDLNRIKVFISDMLSKINHVNLYRVATVEEAIAFLKGRDISIPWHEADEPMVKS